MRPDLIGVDEVGTGAWAGPFVVSAVRVPADWVGPDGLRDSKKMSPLQRETCCRLLLRDAHVTFCVHQVWPKDIAASGQSACWRDAVLRVVSLLGGHDPNTDVIVDGTHTPVGRCEPRADGKYHAVMAACVIGKVFRDHLMSKLAIAYPDYGFEQHKGYGTTQHADAIRTYGTSVVHRPYALKL